VINVEEARTLLGASLCCHLRVPASSYKLCTATAYVNADVFDEYTYTQPASSNHKRRSQSPSSSQAENSDDDQEEENVAFEIPLNTLIECLNIFGTAGTLSHSSTHDGKKERKWKRAGDADEGGFGDEREGTRGPIDNYFRGSKDEKRTGMRMSFAGAGYPLTLLM